METVDKLKFMAEVSKSVVDYLQDELSVNITALKAYEPNAIDDEKRDKEVQKLREVQAMILRDRIAELNRHIKVIQRMYPNA